MVRWRSRCASSNLPCWSSSPARCSSSSSIAVERSLQLVPGGDVVEAGKMVSSRDRPASPRSADRTRRSAPPRPRRTRSGGELLVGRLDVHHVAPDPEAAPAEVHVVAGVLEIHEVAQQDVPPPARASHGLAPTRPGSFWGAHAVDAGDRGHHDHVPPGQQRPGGGVAEPVDLLVA